MNAKIIFSALWTLLLCGCSSQLMICQKLAEEIADDARKSLPFGDYIVSGVGNVCGDVADVCMGVSAPRKDELKNKKIVFLGTLEEGGKVYQIKDCVSFQYKYIVRMDGGVIRMNKAPEVRKRGDLPESSPEYEAMDTLSYYERTGGATAIFKKDKDSKEGEKYTLNFASPKAGTYTYENIENGVLIGKGEGTFDVEDFD